MAAVVAEDSAPIGGGGVMMLLKDILLEVLDLSRALGVEAEAACR